MVNVPSFPEIDGPLLSLVDDVLSEDLSPKTPLMKLPKAPSYNKVLTYLDPPSHLTPRLVVSWHKS